MATCGHSKKRVSDIIPSLSVFQALQVDFVFGRPVEETEQAHTSVEVCFGFGNMAYSLALRVIP